MMHLSRGTPRSVLARAARTRSFSPTTRSATSVAVVGATGAVGHELLQLLQSREFPLSSLKLLASQRSAGRTITFGGLPLVVEPLTEKSFRDVDIALFTAGGDQSRKYAPAAVAAGAVVIDNSSAFRMTPSVPLVIPEVNPQVLERGHQGIIANPNCSTIIMAVPVWALHQKTRVKRMVVSTYQAASGAGAAAMRELERQADDWSQGRPLDTAIFGQQYLWNLFSHNSPVDLETGYNEEELKMIRETKKIFADSSIAVCATCVRVPTLRAHAMSINLSFASAMAHQDAHRILTNTPGVQLMDDRAGNSFPTALAASGTDQILVGRIRDDLSQPAGTGVSLFAAGDQIRKGAALNAIQIAELLIRDDSFRRKGQTDSSSSTGHPCRPVEVHKFGGAALGSAEAIRAVADVLVDRNQKGKSVTAVCSALFGVTDELVGAFSQMSRRDAAAVEATRLRLEGIHHNTAERLLPRAALTQYVHLVRRVLGHALCLNSAESCGAQRKDAVMHCGEVLSAELMAAHLSVNSGVTTEYISSADVIRTDGVYGDATPELTATRQRTEMLVQPALDAGRVVVMPGFFGASQDGQITTFGRGGSDLTATTMGHALSADKITLWKVETAKRTDGGFGGWVRGLCGIVHCADLHRTIPQLSYNEATELGRFGKKVLHHRTVQPVAETEIPVAVRNLREPSKPGSIISMVSARQKGSATTITNCSWKHYMRVSKAEAAFGAGFGASACVVAVVGDRIASNRQLCEHMNSQMSQRFKTFAIPAASNQSPHSICLIMDEADAAEAVQVLHALVIQPEQKPKVHIDHQPVQYQQLRMPNEGAVRMQRRCFWSQSENAKACDSRPEQLKECPA